MSNYKSYRQSNLKPNQLQSNIQLQSSQSKSHLQKSVKIQDQSSISDVSQDLQTYNPSNVKVVCRIRQPKFAESLTSSVAQQLKSNQSQGGSSSITRNYQSLRSTQAGLGDLKRTKGSRQDSITPSKQYVSLRVKSKDGSSSHRTLNRSSSHKGSNFSLKAARDKSGSQSARRGEGTTLSINVHGKVSNDRLYSVFSTRERSNIVVCNQRGLDGKYINNTIINQNDLKYLSSDNCSSPLFNFQFDDVFNESQKQEKFYAQTVRPIVLNFIEGENGCVILFGPTQGGKTYTLKGKAGIERGLLPRSVEDIFNIVSDCYSGQDESCEYDISQMGSDGNGFQNENVYTRNAQNQRQWSGEERVSYPSGQNANQERLFLKMSVYQIFADKILDLLHNSKSSKNSSRQVYIDHLIDQKSEEVVSKIRNLNERVIMSLEDFYNVLQEAYKNRRIQSVSTQQSDLKKKTHLVVNFTLMKKSFNQNLEEISTLNFVELSGSEQAVSEDKFFHDSQIRQFVTKSFNGLSSTILKSALKKKQPYSQLNDSDSAIVGCLRKSLTSQSNILLICNVNPSPSHFEHSLPAVKFCARIRETIVKKLDLKGSKHRSLKQSSGRLQEKQQSLMGQRQDSKTEARQMQNDFSLGHLHSKQQQQTSSDEQGISDILRTAQESIQLLKRELAQRQVDKSKVTSRKEYDIWALEKLESIQVIYDILKQEGHQIEELQLHLLFQELCFLREQIQKINLVNPQSPYIQQASLLQTPQQLHHLKDSYIQPSQSPQIMQGNKLLFSRQAAGIQDQLFSSQSTYNPYQQSTFNQAQSKQQSQNQIYQQNMGFPRSTSQQSLRDQENCFNPLISVQDSNEKGGRPLRYANYVADSSEHLPFKSIQQHIYTDTDPSAEQIHSYGGNRQHVNCGNNGAYSSQYPSSLQSNHKMQINEFTADQMNGSTQDHQQQQFQSIQNSHQKDAAWMENDILNRLHPLANRSLSPKKNSISEKGSPDCKSNIENAIVSARTTQNGFRQQTASSGVKSSGFKNVNQGGSYSTETYQQQVSQPETTVVTATFDSQQTQPQFTQPTTINENLIKTRLFSPIKNPFETMLNQTKVKQQIHTLASKSNEKPVPDYAMKLKTIKEMAVYQTDQEALTDMIRLFRLNDMEGLKLRLTQLLREKESVESLAKEALQTINDQKEQIQTRDQIIIEQDQIIELGKMEFTQTVDSLEKHHKEREHNTLSQSQSVGEHLKDLQGLIKLVSEEKEQLLRAQGILEAENKSLTKAREEVEHKMAVIAEENHKLQSNYSILKEHEINVIRDAEDKKNREVNFYETKMREMAQEHKQFQAQKQDYDQLIFKMKEELRKQELENQKLNQDLLFMTEQLQQYTERIENEEEAKTELQKQCDQYEKEYQNVEEQRDRLEAESQQMRKDVEQLHLLIEKMEQQIQSEQRRQQEEIVLREAKERENSQLKEEKQSLEQFFLAKDREIEQGKVREQSLQEELAKLRKVYEELDKQMTLFKAKEYDKVDVLKKSAELEARLKYLSADNESLHSQVKQHDSKYAQLQKEKLKLEQQVIELQAEVEFLRTANEQHLDQVDAKFEDIQQELSKLRNENAQLKDKEKLSKRRLKEIEEELTDTKERLARERQKGEEVNVHVVEMEREIRRLMEEREREARDAEARNRQEQRHKEESKGVILGDIHNMIRNYKDEKKQQKSGYMIATTNGFSSNNTSGLYQ